MTDANSLLHLAGRHWFYLLLPFAAAAAWAMHLSLDWDREATLGEATALFDWCVFLPAMFLLCYRRAMPSRTLALRTVGLVCGEEDVGQQVRGDGRGRLDRTPDRELSDKR